MEFLGYESLMQDDKHIPVFSSGVFTHILERARHCLKERSVDYLKSKNESLTMLLLDAQPGRFIPDHIDHPDIRDLTLPSALLRLYMKNPDLPDPGLTWYEYFALLALQLTHKAAMDEMIFSHFRGKGKITDEEIHASIAWRAVEAMEATAYAERLRSDASRDEDIQKRIDAHVSKALSERGKKAAKQKNKPFVDLKEEFVSFFLNGSYPSMRNAAERFYDGLPPERKRIYSGKEQAMRHLAAHLSKELRE